MSRQFTVLVIDDDPDDFEAIRIFFEDHPVDVHWADSAVLGAEMGVSLKPDIIILDNMIPPYNALQFMEMVKELPEFSGIQLIVSSNSVYPQIHEELTKAGATLVCDKPLPVSVLNGLLELAYIY